MSQDQNREVPALNETQANFESAVMDSGDPMQRDFAPSEDHDDFQGWRDESQKKQCGPSLPMPCHSEGFKFEFEDEFVEEIEGESWDAFRDFEEEREQADADHIALCGSYAEWISGQAYAEDSQLDLAKELAADHLRVLKESEPQLEETARELCWGFGLLPLYAHECLDLLNSLSGLPWKFEDLWPAILRQQDEPDQPGRRRGWRVPRDGKPSPRHSVTDSNSRPEITITPRRDLVVIASLSALNKDLDLYSRGGKLVIVVDEFEAELTLTAKTKLKGTAGTPKIIVLSESNVGSRLTANADFFAWKLNKEKELERVKAHPPNWLIAAVASHQYYPGFRSLEAIVDCPYPRRDGTIVERPGYDPETRTLYRPKINFPRVPKRPTRDDARAAWGRIQFFFREFPFASEDDAVVVLAGILSIIARPAIDGPVPGIALIGNKAGTGKGLLIDCMAILGTGFSAPTSTYPAENTEAVKVKVGIALSGKRVIHFDNLEEGTTYGSGPMDSALTTTTTEDRVLGSNAMPVLSLRPVWFLSGNNLDPCKDAYRRWIPINLKTELEHPEERTDLEQQDLRKVIREHRGPIVADALTILVAHILEDRPRGIGWAYLGSFEDWDRVIRGAVWYATDRDCLANQRRTARNSPERQRKLALLIGWSRLNGGGEGGSGYTTAEAIAHVENFKETICSMLYAAMMEYGEKGNFVTSSRLGGILRGLKENPIEGLRFETCGTKNGSMLWRVLGSHKNPLDIPDAPE